jgi:hypothetical protein
MKLAKFVAIVGALAQAGILVFAFLQGDFGAAGQFYFNEPWGFVSLVDIYVGILLFSAWVIYREEKLWKALLWVLSFIVLGNFPSGVYAFLALQKSGGLWKRFWMGKNAEAS